MTDPAAARTFLRCSKCSTHTRSDIAGDPARCAFCGALVEASAADQPAPSATPIVARRAFISRSIRPQPEPI